MGRCGGAGHARREAALAVRRGARSGLHFGRPVAPSRNSRGDIGALVSIWCHCHQRFPRASDVRASKSFRNSSFVVSEILLLTLPGREVSPNWQRILLVSQPSVWPRSPALGQLPSLQTPIHGVWRPPLRRLTRSAASAPLQRCSLPAPPYRSVLDRVLVGPPPPGPHLLSPSSPLSQTRIPPPLPHA